VKIAKKETKAGKIFEYLTFLKTIFTVIKRAAPGFSS
jgi:hypothetical protein